MKKRNNIDPGKVEYILGNCVANQLFEGQVCTEDDKSACRRIIKGDTNLNDELDKVVEKYKTVPIWDEDTERYI